MKKIFTFLMVTAISISSISQVSVQWGASVLAYSSTWPGGAQNPAQVLGTYNVYPGCGDQAGAWATATPDGQREFIEIGMTEPMRVSQIQIFQTNAAGAIDTVYVRQQGTSVWTNIYQATASPTACGILDVIISQTSFNVDAIRIAINSPAVPDWNEIDAVRILKNPFNNTAPIYDSLENPIDHFASVVNPWGYAVCVNPNGENKNAIRANNYNNPGFFDAFTQSFDLSGLNKPILSFYVAHKGYSGAGGGGNEGLEVAVSTDGGTNFTPLLLKFRQDNPSLSTEDQTFNFYVPASLSSCDSRFTDRRCINNFKIIDPDIITES